MRRGVVAVSIALLVFGGASCSASDTSSASSTPYVNPDDWPKTYGETSCNDWTNVMTETQRHDAAAQMLSIARTQLDPGSGDASDKLIDHWEKNLTKACPTTTTGTFYISDVASMLYQADRAVYSA